MKLLKKPLKTGEESNERYLKADVTLSADMLEKILTHVPKKIGFFPFQFSSSRAYTWNAGLRTRKCELEKAKTQICS